MILRLTNKTEIVLTKQESQEIEKLIEQGVEFIKVGDSLIKRTLIAGIFPGGDDIKTAVDNQFTLDGKPKCQGQHSIQWAIHQVALRDKTNWPKLVKDKAWREKTRLAIIAKYPNKKWCDYKSNACACVIISP